MFCLLFAWLIVLLSTSSVKLMGNSASLEQRVRALIVSPAYKGTYNYLECTIEDGKLWYDMLATKAKLPP